MRLALPNSQKNFPNRAYWFSLAIGLLLLTLGFTVPYLNSQRAFLGGDINDGFYQFTLQATEAFQRSPLEAVQLIFQSLTQDYNRLFSLPLVPLILGFGNSYLAYVISLAIVYLLPFCLTIGAIATTVIPVYPKAVFASTTLIAALFTPNWITLLQGYPDISAALMMVLSICVALRGVGRQFTWLLTDRWQVPLLGFLFGIGILLRRHFAYAIVAILGAIVIHTAVVFILEFRRSPRIAWNRLLSFLIRISLVVATSLITLLLLAWDFTIRAFTENYVSLYDSWSRPIGDVFQFYGELYGWLVWLVVFAGFIIGVLTQVLSTPAALFISSFGLISILTWLFRLRYIETYYALHFVPFVLLGFAAFTWTVLLSFRGKNRLLTLAFLGILVSWNAIVSITPLSTLNSPFRPLFAAAYPPPIRQNYENVLQVMNFLRQTVPDGEPIFVIYTGHLPMHLILAAERAIYGDTGRQLTMKQGSPTDSDGFYPIEELLEAKYVVLTQPFIGWNEPEQQAIYAVHTAFAEGWEFTEDFAPLPPQFDLQNGVTTTIYQRIRPTSPDRAVRLLHALQTQVNKPLGMQPNWIALDQQSVAKHSTKQRRYNLQTASSSAEQPSKQTFLYVGNLAEKNGVKGRVVMPSECGGADLEFVALNEQGQAVAGSGAIQFTETAPLRLELDGLDAAYLALEVSQTAASSTESGQCSLRINNLVVSSQ